MTGIPTNQHRTRIHTGADVEREWPKLLDELARCGMLGAVGSGALLDRAARERAVPDQATTPPPAS